MQSSVPIRDEQIFPNIRTLLISASKFSFFTLKDEPGNREADSWETAETRNGSTFRSQLPQYRGRHLTGGAVPESSPPAHQAIHLGAVSTCLKEGTIC